MKSPINLLHCSINKDKIGNNGLKEANKQTDIDLFTILSNKAFVKNADFKDKQTSSSHTFRQNINMKVISDITLIIKIMTLE